MIFDLAIIGEMILSINLFFFISFISYSQNKIISGVVNDTYGNPIPGVNILQETQKNNGAVTDFDGNFTIKVEFGSSLIFSFIGFISQEVIVGQK